MHRALLLLLLLALAVVAIGCEHYHVCLRRRKIDTRNAPNISEIRIGKSPALAPSRDLGETGSSGCAYEKLAKQVIVKLSGRGDNAGVRDDLVKLGCAIVHYLPHHSWSVFLPENLEVDRVKRTKGVSWIGEYKPRYKVAPEWQEVFAKKLEEDVLFDSQGRVVATVLTAAGVVSKPCTAKVDILELLIQRWNSSLNEHGKVVELKKLEPAALQAAIPLDQAREYVEWLSKQEWVTWIAPAFRGRLGNMVSSAIQQSGVSAPLERGAPFFPSRPLWGMGIMGDGQIVGVGDSGVDLLSCYFRDEQVSSPGPNHRKVLSYRVMWGGDLIDSYGHGSHVAGSLLGQCDQTLSDFTIESSKYNGMAPHAKLVFTDIGVGKNTYVTPPMDLSDYYWEAYSLGARIHSDSWTTVDRSYNLMSRSVDAFTYNNPAFLPVFAAGNAGSSYSSVGTITSPAMSKNSLTVGASMGPGHSIRHENLALLRFYVLNGTSDLRVGVLENSFGVMFQDNWGPFPLLRAIPGEACISPPNAAGMVVLASREGCDCIDKLVAIQDAGSVAAVFFNNENTGYFPLSLRSLLESITIPSGSIPRVFGDYLDSMLTHGDSVFVEVVGHVPFNGERIDSMTSFSSWGPTLDGRQKPETVAPGDKIVSAKSNMDSKEATCRTLVLSGTSMATPITAGGAALIRQYFMDGFYPTGSKVLAHSRQPSGALVKAILINGAVPLRGLNGNGVIIDPPLSFNQGYGRIDLLHSLFLPGHNKLNVTAEEGNPLKTGFGQRYCFSCFPGSEDLKFTLAWYDPPALPAASVILVNDLDLFVIDPSNTKRYGNGGPRPDRMNNVEQVSVSDPESGLYVAVIYGYYVPEEGPDGFGQRFAFVASAASLSATPCLVINPVEVPPLFGNIANVRITVEGTSGPYIKWFCRLDASIETPKAHDWEICGNDYFAEGLPDAFYTFSVQARDESFLNTAYSEISFASFTIDTIPPRTILLSSSASVFCETPVFEFSSDSADTDHFECQFTSGILSSHGWTLCGSPVKVEARSDGRYTFHVRAVDKAGNQDPQPVFVHWLLHRERPRAKIVTILPKDLTNVSTCRVYFELDVPNLPGIQEPRWSCRLNLSDIEGAAVYGWRSCSSPLELSNLPDGIYIVSVRAAENESGGALSSVPATCTVIIDSLPPEVLFFAVPPLFSSSRDVSYAFASSEVSTTTCCMTKLNTGEEERWQQCTSPARFRNLEDGVYQFSVTATDLAGNTGLVINHRFLVDTTPPSVVSFVLSQPDLDVVTAEFSVDDGPPGSTSGVATCYCRIDSQVQGGTWMPCSSPWKVEKSYLAPGVEHTFMVKAEDRASNIALDHAEQKVVFSLPSNPSAVHGLVCPEAYTRLHIATLAFNSSLPSTECEVDGQVPVACGSPYRVGPLADGAHTFKVRYLSSFSLWSGCKWYIDTGTPETLIRSSVVNTLSPSFELSGYDGGGIERYECMLQSLDPQGQRHSWRKCSRQLVTYSLCPASLYIFHARSIDAAGNVDPNPPQAIFLISYSFFYHSTFSSDVSTNSSYRICRSPGTCKFPLSQSGTIVSTYDGATIVAFPKSLRESHYELSSSPYASAALSGNALDMGIVARLCVPVSNVSSLASTSHDEQPFAIFLMLRKTNESSPTVPLAISTGNATPNYTNELQLIYTRESPILVTTMWELVAAQLDQEGTYVTTLVTRPGSYMLARIYEGPTLAFIKASQPRMIVSSTMLIFMCLCILI